MRLKLIITAICLIISGCKSGDVVYKYPKNKDEREYDELGSVVTGDKEGSLKLFGSNKVAQSSVNSYLWKAALEVISFIPIMSADAVGGVITTDWYSDPKTPNEKLKFNIIIATTDLEATSLNIKGFRQVKVKGQWQNAKMSDATVKDLENKILAKARKLRYSSF